MTLGAPNLFLELEEPVKVRLLFGRATEARRLAFTADEPEAVIAAVAARVPSQVGLGR